MNGKIVVVGSSNTDMVIQTDRLPVPGETVLGGIFMMNQGGKGANQAVAAARMGGKVAFIAKTGNDLFGKESIKSYENEGIDTQYVFSDDRYPSGVALITVDKNGENCIVVGSGANGMLYPKDIDQARNVIEIADILLMQLEIPMETVEYVADIAFRKGVKVILNPAPAQFLSDELLKKLFLIIPNATEAEFLSGTKVSDWESAKHAAGIIGSKGIDNVVITLGAMGALIKQGNEFLQVSSERVHAIDTTAAGDTFCGSLCVALSEGNSIADAVRFANACSSITVTRMGAQPSIPYRKEISF